MRDCFSAIPDAPYRSLELFPADAKLVSPIGNFTLFAQNDPVPILRTAIGFIIRHVALHVPSRRTRIPPEISQVYQTMPSSTFDWRVFKITMSRGSRSHKLSGDARDRRRPAIKRESLASPPF